jgi:hypothetical protein
MQIYKIMHVILTHILKNAYNNYMHFEHMFKEIPPTQLEEKLSCHGPAQFPPSQQ